MIYLAGITKNDRQGMITFIKEVIDESGGWISNFTLFSNISIGVDFVIPAGNSLRLLAALESGGLQLNESGRRDIETQANLQDQSSETGSEVTVRMNVTFVHDDPDLRIPIPAIPG
ncbi:MAG: hypothetical protein IPL01_08920 [Acidobacteria bacterium]|nr:hypothetical protein [Acidobacteriota bacterium]